MDDLTILCEGCQAPLSAERAKDFVVCGACFEARLARWVAADPRPKPPSAPLAVQEQLVSGKPLATLAGDLGLRVYEHPSDPLVGLKYDQRDSPRKHTLTSVRKHPVVRECRGLVLERDSWNVVAKPFERFFNPGEDPEEFARFDWTNFTCTAKEDGSLAIVYHYGGRWRVNTSGSFALGICGFSGKTWERLFWETMPSSTALLNPECTYLFELCTPWNKVVRSYPDPRVYLLSAFDLRTCLEVPDEAQEASGRLGVQRPLTYDLRSFSDIEAMLRETETRDRSFEGVVIRDSAGRRFKVKTTTYVALHHMHDNGNLFNPRCLVPLLLKGERDEVLAYFPEGREAVDRVAGELNAAWVDLRALWARTWRIENQKDFALAVKSSPFAGLLFSTRKAHAGRIFEASAELLLSNVWRESADLIVKRLYPSAVNEASL